MSDTQALPIVVNGLTKKYGKITALNDVSFTVEPGRVTGFLGPNGAGKSTALRILLNLDAATSGTATIGGKEYRDYDSPATVIGANLEADLHPGRSGRNHLRVYAAAMGIPDTQVPAVLELVGLTDAADRKTKTYSLGMKQRLGLATAMLSNPQVLILDEPVNGLAPEGIRWMRGLLQDLAAQGRTVLLSSHLLSEIQMIAQDIIIINRGDLIAAGNLKELEARGQGTVLVDAADREGLASALNAAGLQTRPDPNGIVVLGATAADIGAVAHQAAIPLLNLSTQNAGLEDLFLNLTGGPR